MLRMWESHMIRKAIVAILFTASLMVCFCWATSYDNVTRQNWPQGLDSYTYYPNPQKCFYLTSLRGWVRVGKIQMNKPFRVPSANDRDGWMWFGLRTFPDPDLRSTRFGSVIFSHCGGLWYTFGGPFASGTISAISVPHWALFIILIAYPATACTCGLLRRRRRLRKHLCRNCGYNLTGNVSGKCSECGQLISEEV